MNICVVGTGYVGLVTGACFAEFGNPVVCVDKDSAKIERLNAGEIPIYEPGLDDIVRRNVQAERLSFSTDLSKSIREALVILIAVGTPQGDDGRADLSFVRAVAKSVAENLNSYKVIVTKSTVPAGTGKMIREIIEEHRAEDHPFSVASNPEFLREGAAIEDFMRPNRVVLGTEDEMAAAQSIFPRAEEFGVHDLIDPRETRPRICDWLDEVEHQLRAPLRDHPGPRRYTIRP